jgi:hypothetical protein
MPTALASFRIGHKAEQNVGAKVGAAPCGASIGYDSTIGDSEAHLEPEPFVGTLIVRRPLQQCTYFARSVPVLQISGSVMAKTYR